MFYAFFLNSTNEWRKIMNWSTIFYDLEVQDHMFAFSIKVY